MAGVFSIANSAEGLQVFDETSPWAVHRTSPREISQLPFIGDERNELLAMVAQQLFDGDFQSSPLVFCGPSATGKTFLAQTLLQALSQRFGWTTADAILMTAADYARQVAQAVETNSLQHFRSRFASVQAFVLDACQHLPPKPQVQRELLALLDDFQDSGRLVIVTATSLPTRIENLSSGLASRLSEGIALPLHPPGPGARRTILQWLFASQQVPVDDEVLDWLVQELTGPVPELTRAVNRLCFEQRQPRLEREHHRPARELDESPADNQSRRSVSANDEPLQPSSATSQIDEQQIDDEQIDEQQIDEQPIDERAEVNAEEAGLHAALAERAALRSPLKLAEARRTLRGTTIQRPATRVIAQRVAREFHLRIKDLTSSSRKQSIVRARGIAMFLSRRINKESLEKIGDFFGGRDHTTVLHSCRKIAKDLQDDPATERLLRELASEFQIPWSEIETTPGDEPT